MCARKAQQSKYYLKKTLNIMILLIACLKQTKKSVVHTSELPSKENKRIQSKKLGASRSMIFTNTLHSYIPLTHTYTLFNLHKYI